LDEDESIKINAAVSNPSTKFPVDIPGIKFSDIIYTGRIDLSQFAQEIKLFENTEETSNMELDDTEENKDHRANPNEIHFHRIMKRPDTTDKSLHHNEFVVCDESQVIIHYVVEVDSVSKLKNSLRKGIKQQCKRIKVSQWLTRECEELRSHRVQHESNN